ncbi:hypothetical protein AG1IA_06310 [Rhizoctonia solani AG-1 IA]|uniref:Uncharacterized protein n=1 Tax=Thanatephorus cucumeris (strain AG1-IA) TaxID=983506 RepID=L8WTG4_THACA|nr:hypothetical protein AG1IA_06310 [Rhizoctonia solani AG-1 IA]
MACLSKKLYSGNAQHSVDMGPSNARDSDTIANLRKLAIFAQCQHCLRFSCTFWTSRPRLQCTGNKSVSTLTNLELQVIHPFQSSVQHSRPDTPEPSN